MNDGENKEDDEGGAHNVFALVDGTSDLESREKVWFVQLLVHTLHSKAVGLIWPGVILREKETRGDSQVSPTTFYILYLILPFSNMLFHFLVHWCYVFINKLESSPSLPCPCPPYLCPQCNVTIWCLTWYCNDHLIIDQKEDWQLAAKLESCWKAAGKKATNLEWPTSVMPQKYLLLKDIHLWKIFDLEKYLPLKSI